jgi:hypothetical protein
MEDSESGKGESKLFSSLDRLHRNNKDLDSGFVILDPKVENRNFIIAMAVMIVFVALGVVSSIFIPKDANHTMRIILGALGRYSISSIVFLGFLRFLVSSKPVIKHIISVVLCTLIMIIPLTIVTIIGLNTAGLEYYQYFANFNIIGLRLYIFPALIYIILAIQITLLIMLNRKNILPVLISYAIFLVTLYFLTGLYPV